MSANSSSRTERVLRDFHEESEVVGAFDRRLAARLWPFIRPQSKGLALTMGMLALISALALLRPLIMRSAFEGATTQTLTRAGFLLLVVIVGEQILTFAQMYSMQVVVARAMHDLRRGVFEFLHTQRLQFFDRRPIGRLVTRVTNDTDSVGELFASGALNAFGDVLRLFGIVILMLALDWRMSLIAFALVPLIGIFVEIIRRKARTAYRSIRTKLARLNAFLNEQVQGIAVVQSFCREKENAIEFDDINLAYRNAHFRAISLEASLDATIEMVSSICIASILWYAGVKTFHADVSFGTLVAFVAYIEQFFVPIRDLSSRYTIFQSAMAGAERVFELLDHPEPDAVVSTHGSHATPTFAFEFDHVSFGYHPNTPVLHDICLQARHGEKIAIVGPTGSGKSTIASLLLRLYDPQQGVIRIEGRDVHCIDRQELRQHFSVVPQELYLFSGTLASNVAVGQHIPDRKRVEEGLRRVGAGDLIDDRPGGIDTRIDERGTNLSVGQRQLVAFARALYRDAPIVLLDEATASVDSTTEAKLQGALAELMKGRTALIIAHRLSTIRSADRIIVLHHGRIVEQGSHDELMHRRGLYAKLHALQLSRESAPTALTASHPSESYS
ncbi:MAG TPA: ABC transporter ATP-binding protein [Polyangiaceae bacterium]|nr:ABC transporter ATP-binding protein [Polyangiaceae bacterium]